MILPECRWMWDGIEGVEERYDIEAVSSPSGVTHLTFTRSMTEPADVPPG